MRPPASPGSPESPLPLGLGWLNLGAVTGRGARATPAYAVVVRMAAKSAARIAALRRDDRIIEPSLLPVGKKLRFPPERGSQYSADVGFVQSDIRRERRFTLTPWTSRSTRSSRSASAVRSAGRS